MASLHLAYFKMLQLTIGIKTNSTLQTSQEFQHRWKFHKLNIEPS